MSDRYNKSNGLYERALKTIPLASQTFSKSSVQYPKGASPLFVERGQGSHVWDVDGNEYVDFVSSLLPIGLGYCDPDIDAAIKAQLDRGIVFSLPSPLEMELSELLVELIPCAEQVRFGKNGTDATSAAIRLSRAFTGRAHIIALGYHGWQDWYIGATTRNKGVPDAVGELTNRIAYNDLDALDDAFKAAPDGVACVIMEPMNFDMPNPGYLEGVRRMCNENGALLVFDEVITGFRFAPGGAQEMLGVTPDLAAFGKAMGNGMPISAIAGRRDVMQEMENVFFSGTFGGETLSLAAAIAVIKKIKAEPVIDHLWTFGQKLIDGTLALIEQHGLDQVLAIKGLAPWSTLAFSAHETASAQAIRTRYIVDMMAQGILTLGAHNISYAHDDADLDLFLSANARSFANLRRSLDAGSLEPDLDVDVIYPVFQVRGESEK